MTWFAQLLWWDETHLHFETEDGWEFDPLRSDFPAELPLRYGSLYKLSCWTDADGDQVSIEPVSAKPLTEGDRALLDEVIVELQEEIARLEALK